MHRLSMGQQPHVDYHTPIGWLAYGQPWLGHLALGQTGGALEFGSATMLAVLLPLAAVALHGRVPAGPGLLPLFALFAIVAVYIWHKSLLLRRPLWDLAKFLVLTVEYTLPLGPPIRCRLRKS